MIEFVPGPHGEIVHHTTRKKLTKFLDECTQRNSASYLTNITFNNASHFQNPLYNYDTEKFLKELHYIAAHKHSTVTVMGDVHNDPFGHSTSLIGQYDDYGTFAPAIVRDEYIRFKIHQPAAHFKVLHAINTHDVFHFLTGPPTIVQFQLPKTYNAYTNHLPVKFKQGTVRVPIHIV